MIPWETCTVTKQIYIYMVYVAVPTVGAASDCSPYPTLLSQAHKFPGSWLLLLETCPTVFSCCPLLAPSPSCPEHLCVT